MLLAMLLYATFLSIGHTWGELHNHHPWTLGGEEGGGKRKEVFLYGGSKCVCNMIFYTFWHGNSHNVTLHLLHVKINNNTQNNMHRSSLVLRPFLFGLWASEWKDKEGSWNQTSMTDYVQEEELASIGLIKCWGMGGWPVSVNCK